jgi:methylmalonyl-CoA carboxyltransferase large subunit
MAKTVKTRDLGEMLEQVQAQLAALAERVGRLESPAAAAPPAAATPVSPAPPQPEISDEEMAAVSAALAAYLGVRVRIRRIRLLSSRAWAQQGRVNIQASHTL